LLWLQFSCFIRRQASSRAFLRCLFPATTTVFATLVKPILIAQATAVRQTALLQMTRFATLPAMETLAALILLLAVTALLQQQGFA